MPRIRDWGIYVALVISTATAVGGTPHLTLDINTKVEPRSSMPTLMGTLNGSVYFSAYTTPGAGTTALFKTDGTVGGTTRVKDINGLGVLLNFPSNLSLGGINDRSPLFFAAGSKAYFAPVENTTGQEIWVTDGTSDGTHIVEDLYPGQGGDPLMLGVLGTKLIFIESTSNSSRQIYATDGTAAGTVALTSTNPMRAGGAVVLNGKMYFIIDQGLWVTDGTPAGTQQLGAGSPYPLNPYSLTVFENALLFIGTDANSGNTSLLRIDPAYNVPQLIAGAQYRGVREINSIAVMDGYVLYVGYNSQLWKYDGSGVAQITSFSQPDALGSQDTSVTRVADHAVFRAQGSAAGVYLWSTDGTTQGTVPLIADPDPVNSGALPLLLGVEGNHGYFIVSGPSGAQIAVTDGTAAGTQLLAGLGTFATTDSGYSTVSGTDSLAYLELVDNTTTPQFTRRLFGYAPATNTLTKLYEGVQPGQIVQLVYNNSTLFFDAWDPVTGDEPWISNGTVAGTQQLANIEPESLTDDSHPASLVNFGGKVAFLADDGRNDGPIWISDGTAAGTTLLPNIAPSNPVFPTKALIGAGGALYFFAYGDDQQYQLMRVAQPGSQPQTLADLSPPQYPLGPWSTVLNGELYFVASKGNVNALYKTDGTAAGTVAVTDQSVGFPSNVYTVGNKIFFLGGQQVFATDGTSAGTVQLSQATNYATLGGGSTLPVLDGAVYFTTTDTSNNIQFWKTDGTVAGTVATASFPAVSGQSTRTQPIATMNGKLLVETLPPNSQGAPLSVSDGTAANTTALNTPVLGYTAAVTVIGSKAYFAAANANGGFDPWVTDGSPAGTYMLTSVDGAKNAEAVWFMDFNGVTLFEVAQDGGSLLYQTDGTAAGTKLIGPIGMTPFLGIPAVFPREHVVVGQNLFFPAVDAAAGAELFALPNNAPVAVADTGTSENGTAVTINVLANDTDSDGSVNTSTVQITTNPGHGSVTVGAGGVVTYTPTAGYSGQDTFAYTVTDNQGSVSAPAQVTVTVTPAVTVSTGDSGSKGGGGGGSIGIMDIAVLMALLQIGAWRQRLRRPRDVARGHRFRERTDAGGDILQR